MLKSGQFQKSSCFTQPTTNHWIRLSLHFRRFAFCGYQPKIVIERRSTQVVEMEDSELARVCRFIRTHACDGINVAMVAENTSLSRRQLERRFQEVHGRKPHEEITAVQIDRVKQLLRETEMTSEQIAPKSGYAHKESLSAVFKGVTGLTPGEYRRQHNSPRTSLP